MTIRSTKRRNMKRYDNGKPLTCTNCGGNTINRGAVCTDCLDAPLRPVAVIYHQKKLGLLR